ncbi:predicted GPI-anchored protein 57 [Chrysoperla carnea]|uniref:predicted GPI-anchored protein 57 n=1 Tax=Chrysoperla carnea TaxID=189513 RepID=UPI001D0858A6|nr:predicted GPI-anchored protein 57 [Chrysoperla carnea]
MYRFLVFGILTIVFLFHHVSADVKPLTLQDVHKTNDQINPISDLKDALLTARIARTLHKGKSGYSKGGSYCSSCGYAQPQPQYYNQGGGGCSTCGGGGGGGGSWSSSSSSSSSGSWGGYGKK